MMFGKMIMGTIKHSLKLEKIKNCNNVFRLCRRTSWKTYSYDNGYDWKGKLGFLQFNEREVLDNSEKISHKVD